MKYNTEKTVSDGKCKIQPATRLNSGFEPQKTFSEIFSKGVKTG
jgi:hypothetical protein